MDNSLAALGKLLLLIGGFILLAGGVIYLLGRVPGLGKLPGDIYIKRENFTFFFPITTMILISIILSLVLRFFRR